MANACSICNNINRKEIERQIGQGVPYLRIAKEFGLTDTSVRNHALNHLSRQLLKSQEIKNRIDAEELLNEIVTCLNKTKTIRSKAEQSNNLSQQISANREIRSTVEFLVRLIVDLSRLEQEREIAMMANNNNHNPVILFPTISENMSAERAGQIYKEFLKTLEVNNADTIVLLPEEKNLDEIIKEQSPLKKMQRTTKPGSGADRIRASVEVPDQDQEADEIEEILNWTPPVSSTKTRTAFPGVSRR